MNQLKYLKSNKFIKLLKVVKISTWIIIAILILAGTIRMIGITKESYWVDEILTVRQGQATLPNLNSYLKDEMHMPLYIYLLWGWIHIFGISEIATRTFSAILGVLCVYLIFLIGKRMFNEKTGIYAAILLALSPIAVYYSQEARLYSMFMLLVLISFYMFISYLKYNKNSYLIAYMLANILMLYTNIFAFIVLGIHAIWIIFKNHKYLKNIFIAIIISILSLIPIITHIISQYANFDKSDKSWLLPSINKIALMLIHYFGNFILLSLAIIIIIISLINYILKKRKYQKNYENNNNNNNNLLILTSWAIIPIISIFVLAIIQPLFHERYMLFTLPAYLLIISFLITQFKNKYTYVTLLLISILSIGALIAQYNQINKDDWRNTAQFLKDNVKEEDYLLLTPYYHQESLTYYYNPQCFKERFMEHCNYVTKNIITINIGQNCCNYTTLVVDHNQLGYLLKKNNTIWLIQNREWINNNATPYNYISTQKNFVLKYQFNAGFGSYIDIYKFK